MKNSGQVVPRRTEDEIAHRIISCMRITEGKVLEQLAPKQYCDHHMSVATFSLGSLGGDIRWAILLPSPQRLFSLL